jgi:penicillin-binding protein 1A
LSPEEAYLTTSLLESVVKSGTGRLAQAIGRPIAGKTGTTNQVKDAWFVGYSTDLCTAVWVGYDDALPLGAQESGTRTALPAFVDFMTAAHENRPRTEFPRPPGIVTALIDPTTGYLPEPGQANAIEEEFLDGTVPQTVAPQALAPQLPAQQPGAELPVTGAAPTDTPRKLPYKPLPDDIDQLPP